MSAKTAQDTQLLEVLLARSVDKVAQQGELSLNNFLKYAPNFHIPPTWYQFKSRYKSWDALSEKVHRKRAKEDKTAYALIDISDCVGLRVLTLHRRELPAALSAILELIQLNSLSDAFPFIANSLTEATIYHTGSSDAIDDKIKQMIEDKFTSNIPVTVQLKPKGYAGIQLNCHLKSEPLNTEELQHAPGFSIALMEKLKQYKLPLEIQIHTVFDDTWREIGKKLNYRPDLKQDIDSTLANLKRLTDACAHTADMIKQPHTEPVETDMTTALDTLEEISNVLEEFGIPERFSDPLLSQYVTFERINQSRSVKHHTIKQQIHGLIASLGQLYVKAQSAQGILHQTAGRPLDSKQSVYFYYLKMLEGMALLRTAELAEESAEVLRQHTRVNEVFLELFARFPDNDAVKARLGRSYGMLQDRDRAITLLQSAYDSISNREFDKQKDFNEQAFEQLKMRIGKELGYQYWRTVEERFAQTTDKAQRQTLTEELQNAYRYTLDSIDRLNHEQEKKHFAHKQMYSNLLYYGAALKSWQRQYHLQLDEKILDSLARCFEFYQKNVPDIDEIENLNDSETLAIGYLEILAAPVKAIKAANKLANLVNSPRHQHTANKQYYGKRAFEIIELASQLVNAKP